MGEPALLQGTWRTPSTLAYFDPSDARVDVTSPAGVTTTYTYLNSQVTRVSAGIYTYSADTTGQPGRWQYRWWCPGPVGQGASMSQFYVDPYPAPVP